MTKYNITYTIQDTITAGSKAEARKIADLKADYDICGDTDFTVTVSSVEEVKA